MDERELIQVNLQLPSDALDKLSALVEQFRRLAAAVNGLRTPAGMAEETAESGFFEPERFQALREKAEAAAKRRSAKELAEAASAQREVLTQLQDAESAGREITEEPASGGQPASLPAAEEIRQESIPQRGNDVQGTDEADIPAVRQEVESHVPDAPAEDPTVNFRNQRRRRHGMGRRRLPSPLPSRQTRQRGWRRRWGLERWSQRTRSRLPAGGPA